MQLRSTLFVSALMAAGATPLLARQARFEHHDRFDVLETLQDEQGHRTTAVRPGTTARAPVANQALVSNWQTLGPFGGDMDDVQASPANPSIVLAGLAPSSGGGGGMYRSTDAGATWTSVATLDGKLVHDIAFAPDGTAYAGTIDGVWKSTNGGATFVAQNLGIGLNDEVLDVDVDPSDPLRLWIGVSDALGNQPVRVMLSVNGGTTWANRTPPVATNLGCTAVAIDPTNPNEVYAGFAGFGGGGAVWVSTNGGTGWTDRTAGLPLRPVNDIVHDGTRALVAGGQLFGSQTFGLFTSPNDGVTWTPLHDGSWPNLVVNDIAIDPNNLATIYVATAGAGLFRSTTGGTAWSFSVGGTGGHSTNAVSFSPGSSSTIYTGSASIAVWKSSDAGASFTASSQGIGSLDVYAIDSNPLNADEIAIAFQGLNNGGVFTTTNGGTTWSLAALPGTRFNDVQFSPQGTLYSISDGPTSIGAEALYRRTGAVWTSIGPDQGTLFESELFGMQVSANDPQFIVAVGADFGVAGAEPTVWRTINGGGLWTKVYEGVQPSRPFQDVAIVDPAGETTWVASHVDFTGGNAGGVLRSTNSAVTWNPSNTGFPVQMQAYSVSRSPIDGALYVSNSASASGVAVWKSVDGGASWSSTGGVGQAFEVVASEFDANTLYIAQLGAVRVRESVNGGATYAPFNTGLLTNDFPRDLQRAQGVGSDLLLATSKSTFATALVPEPVPFCFGDGTGTPCPCAPPSAPGTGCLNSFGTGALLASSGSNAVGADTLSLNASGLPASTSVLFFQGTTQQNGGLGSAFGDGLRCAAGTVIRLGTETASGGNAVYPGVGDPTVSVRGMVPPTGGLRHYQAWYRNAAAFCTASTFNLSNGLSVTWVP